MPLEKTNVTGYWKDTDTHTVINKNYGELEVYLNQRKKSKEFQNLVAENNEIKNELKEIKSLLNQLIKDKLL